MKNEGVFRFKQFEVSQAGCAMKINTDGVLIGAMANHSDPKNILDIGTGTGVIALMLAQRFSSASIKAVEIDSEASTTAAANFKNSTFNNRLKVENIAIAAFETDLTFDLIVSNPPFFVNDLKNVDKRKEIARHAEEDFFEHLIKKVSELLSEFGLFWVILPVKQAEILINLGLKEKLFVSQKVRVCSDNSKAAVRNVLCFSREQSKIVERNFYIYESLNVHPAEYKALPKDFFLAF
ncbi:tRNA1Val (adenine37-N6)-methyltransferase [Pedobacter sp. UYP30]|uniref:tRNA1(Val) (adenine(37)-N6)-methyltransferase n=1 Tax=Pedobacter sp. UYP30 TaxID=1756400 RepID=UPI003395C56D